MTRVSRVRSVRVWGPSTGPTACTLADRRCSLWGWRKGVPGGGAFHHCEGRLRSGAVPPPTARLLSGLLGSATHVLWARVCGCGGPTLFPWPACPVRAACRGGGGGPSPGGVACHRCEGRLVSGAIPPPAARPLERAAWAPRPVCPGCGRCGRGDPAPAPQRAPLRAGVARCGGGGRASRGGVLSTVVRGAWRQALSLPRPPVLWSGQSGFRVPCVPAAVGAGVGTQHQPHSVRPCGLTLLAVGVAEGRPRGVLSTVVRGGLVSGAVPPPAACPLERAARVPRPVCRGCGRCGRGDPAPAPQRAPLRAGVARCGGGGRASRGGVLSTVVRGALRQALSLPRPPVLWSGQSGFRVPCVPAAVGAGVGTQHRPHSVRPCGLTLLAVGVAEGRPRGVLSTVVRGGLVSGAVPPPAACPLERAARVPRPVCPGCGRFGRGDPAPVPQRACALAGRRFLLWEWRRGVPGGVLSTIVRGGWCHALSLPQPLVLWSGRPGFRDPYVPGAVDAGVGTQHRPHSVRPCGPALLAVGVAEERPRGGAAFHYCEGRLVSGAVPPPAARPLERAARVPRPVCPGCGRCGRGDPAPVPQRAPLRAGVARCGGGGRASPGGVPSTIVRGAWCQALSLPRQPVLWSGQPGFRVPCVPGAVGAGVGTQHRSHSVRPCGPALLAVGVAEGRPRGGCFPPL